eukprot:TRINITY_DN2261_c0_g1_i3.p1 TRINITY_DN2261_c0_g1~~TRINITY_DN2261_c0_g1_i3.p1  ORF type:complete len:459 (-),score=76.71 TRINITY_DN2261_c0_g1_i3:28-1404(-)
MLKRVGSWFGGSPHKKGGKKHASLMSSMAHSMYPHTHLWHPYEADMDQNKKERDGKDHKKKVYRSPTHRFVSWLTESIVFSAIIMTVILANTVFIAVETSRDLSRNNLSLFQGADFVFLAIYTLEFIAKVYAQPMGYWSNGYNRFDFAILLFSYLQFLSDIVPAFAVVKQVGFLRVLRALRALRALRGVSFIRGLQVILVALFRTLANIINLVALLLLLMYVFAIMGYELFHEADDSGRFASLGDAYYTLFTYVTADGWTDTQASLDRIHPATRLYTLFFLFIGHFIFTNLFIGVVIQVCSLSALSLSLSVCLSLQHTHLHARLPSLPENLDEATEEDKRLQHWKRTKAIQAKKLNFLTMQEADLSRLVKKHAVDNSQISMQEALQLMVGRLRHDELVPMTHLSTNVTWLETYLVTCSHLQNGMYKTQQLHFEIANTLASLVHRRELQMTVGAVQGGH